MSENLISLDESSSKHHPLFSPDFFNSRGKFKGTKIFKEEWFVKLHENDSAAYLVNELSETYKPEEVVTKNRKNTPQQRAWELFGWFYLKNQRF